MSITEQITVKKHSRVVEMLSNVPKPSGDDNTITLDYGQKMVCQQPDSRTSFFEQDAKRNVPIITICSAIGEVAIENPFIEEATVVGFLAGEITIGGSLAVYSATVTAPVNGEALILKSIENWIPKNAVKFSSSKFEVTDGILCFCSNHNIVKYLRPITSLIEESFPSLQEPYLEIEEDPESDREWLTFSISIKGEIKEVLGYYNNYVTQLVSKIPWPEREKFRLSYNII